MLPCILRQESHLVPELYKSKKITIRLPALAAAYESERKIYLTSFLNKLKVREPALAAESGEPKPVLIQLLEQQLLSE